jgi:hypothetical protein
MFLIMIFGISIANNIKGRSVLSVYENRNLEKRPGLEELKKGEFAPKYESYYADQFIMRDKIIRLKTKFDMIMGKSQINDIFVTRGKWLLPLLTVTVDEKGIKEQAEKLNAFNKELQSQGKLLYLVFTPYKGYVLKHLYPSYATGLNAIPQNLKLYTDSFDEHKINYSDIDNYFLNNYTKKNLESFYFKTDHHWNIFGAYEGTKYVIENLAKSSKDFKNLRINDSEYKKTYIKNKVFSGSYNRSLYNLIDINEAIPYMNNVNKPDYKFFLYENGAFVEKKFEELYFSGRNSETVPYEQVYAQGLPYYKITNQSAKTDKKSEVGREILQ